MASSQLLLSFAAAAPAALLSGVLTWAIRPMLIRIALAKPNARSSHRVPTPQGGGIAVIAATLFAVIFYLWTTYSITIGYGVNNGTKFAADP